MRVLIDVLKMAEELAHQAVKDELLDLEDAEVSDKYKEEVSIYTDHTKKQYNKVAQDCFNRHMDYFTEMITNGAIEDDPIKKAFVAKKITLQVSQQTYNFCNTLCNVFVSGEEKIYQINDSYFYLTINEKMI